jgi:hypothetical protein
LEFLKRVKNAATIDRLRDRAQKDGSPRGYVDLCHALVVQGSPVRALSVAQEGVRRFPRSLELADQLRLIWGQTGRGERHRLERTASQTLSVGALCELVEHYLAVQELDPALQAAERLVSHHPESAAGPRLVARVLWKRFIRDHVARDGMKLLDSLRTAAAMDPRSFETFHLLAETCFYVGLVGKAIEAAATALALEPTNQEAMRLNTLLANLSAESAPEEDLVRGVEERDGPWRGYVPADVRAGSQEPPIQAQITRMLHEISLMAGVRSLALARDGICHVGRDGTVFEERRTPPLPLVALTTTFRGRIAAGTKHLGIGAFQEAEIMLSASTVLAFGAMSSVLLVEVEPGIRTQAIVAVCRDVMGCVDRDRGGAVHA